MGFENRQPLGMLIFKTSLRESQETQKMLAAAREKNGGNSGNKQKEQAPWPALLDYNCCNH
ncbi:hypothetical protein CHCC15087_3799 [Bacillus licheniformis]|uniref:XRE family transcriptional regulator n=2 Tax=Bacillaceae TaxID=186817 RepID=A0A2I7ZJM4_9BACI|nr:XRE family transcriptional regulator [Bacillus glycinifermentans]AUS92829.1 hypothetical protein [Bacillus glycinifermentans]TWM23240.1 hypothetical protein CHCC15087_3799 [Bacillus licheniformis]